MPAERTVPKKYNRDGPVPTATDCRRRETLRGIHKAVWREIGKEKRPIPWVNVKKLYDEGWNDEMVALQVRAWLILDKRMPKISHDPISVVALEQSIAKATETISIPPYTASNAGSSSATVAPAPPLPAPPAYTASTPGSSSATIAAAPSMPAPTGTTFSAGVSAHQMLQPSLVMSGRGAFTDTSPTISPPPAYSSPSAAVRPSVFKKGARPEDIFFVPNQVFLHN